jgi:ribulokinase
VLNVPTVFVKSRIGAPLGDAVLAGVATQVFPDFSIAKRKAEYIDRLEPVQENHDLYMQYFAIYQSLYQHVKEDFVKLAQARGR